MRMTMDSAANSVVVDALGGMVLKGAGAGDYYATVSTQAGTTSPVELVMVKHGSSVQLRIDGETHTVSLPSTVKPAAAAGFDLNAITPYVKDVSVSTINVNGRVEDDVTGTIDGNALLQNLPGVSTGVLWKLRRLPQRHQGLALHPARLAPGRDGADRHDDARGEAEPAHEPLLRRDECEQAAHVSLAGSSSTTGIRREVRRS